MLSIFYDEAEGQEQILEVEAACKLESGGEGGSYGAGSEDLVLSLVVGSEVTEVTIHTVVAL